jgi:glycosyltransferase involved in cell wall biosynthesis
MATDPPAGLTACTIVARNYLPAARVLAASFLAQHTGGRVCVLVVDDFDEDVDPSAEQFEVVRPVDLDLAPEEFLRMAMLYDVTELCTAVKPWLLRLLLDRGAGVVLYLDPDIEVFASLEPLASAAREHGIAIVPHTESPIPLDGCEPTEQTILHAGAYNLGFIGVSDAARPFLSWWEERLARECYRDVNDAHFVDQRFVDLVPGMFDPAIVRDPAYNVAYWNLHSRSVTRRDDRYEVDGRPLAFFHYSGYSPRRPHILFSYHHDEDRGPRVLLSEHPAVAELCRGYVEQLAAAGGEEDLPLYAFGTLDDGTTIDIRMRRLYREQLALADRGEGPEPANPFRDGTPAFVEWLREPTYPRVAPQVGRYLHDIWDEDPNLQHEFPELEPETADVYLEWCSGPASANLPACVLLSETELQERRIERRRARPIAARPPGVNVVGYHGAVLGLGEVARSIADGLRAAGVDVAAIGHPETLSQQLGDVACVEPIDAPYDVNVFVVNADMMPPLAGQLGPDFFAGRRSVGIWFWEVDTVAPPPTKALQVLDEVWVASEHTGGAVEPVSSKPVHVVPIPMPSAPAGTATSLARRDVGLPDDRFVFLMALDFFSVGERKNPWGLVEAYRSAFGPDDGAALVVKTINGVRRADELERLRLAAGDRADIVIRDEYLSRAEQTALMASCDAYVSLHRSEGLGLTMVEAMALAKPVIATGYSGNMQFMDESVAFLVPYTLREIGPDHHPYPAHARWAEPDLEHAGKLMRQVFEEREGAAEVGQRAAARIRDEWSATAMGPQLAERVAALRARSDVPPTWREFFMRGWRPLLRGRVHRNYDFDWLPDGMPVDLSMQALFDHALGRARSGRGRPAPDPDDEGGTEAVLAWLNKPFAPRIRPVVSRYLVQYWHDHPELHERFPVIETDRAAARAYVDWVRDHWHDDTDVPRRLAPS